MGSNGSIRDKMDALDLVINALMDHEKRLDTISHRLEALAARTGRAERPTPPAEAPHAEPSAPQEESERQAPSAPPGPSAPRIVEGSPRVLVRSWSDFTATCRGASLVAFELVENHFTVDALLASSLLTYREDLPATRVRVAEDATRLSLEKASVGTIDALHVLFQKRLRCGLALAIESTRTRLSDHESLLDLHYALDSEAAKTFLADALGVARDKIVEGQITV